MAGLDRAGRCAIIMLNVAKPDKAQTTGPRLNSDIRKIDVKAGRGPVEPLSRVIQISEDVLNRTSTKSPLACRGHPTHQAPRLAEQ